MLVYPVQDDDEPDLVPFGYGRAQYVTRRLQDMAIKGSGALILWPANRGITVLVAEIRIEWSIPLEKPGRLILQKIGPDGVSRRLFNIGLAVGDRGPIEWQEAGKILTPRLIDTATELSLMLYGDGEISDTVVSLTYALWGSLK